MHRKRLAVALAAMLTLSTVAAACGDDDSGDEADNTTTTEKTTTTEAAAAATAPEDNGGRKDGNGTLTFGAVLPQTGKLAQLGPPMIQGAQMAIRDVNAGDGVNGKDVSIEVKDDGGDSNVDLAKANVDQLINNTKIDALIGAAPSGTTKEIIDKVTDSGTVECSPSNTGSDLTTWKDKGLYFRTPPPDNLQAQALAKAISDDGKQSVAIIAQNTDYGTGFVRFLEPALKDAGVEITENVSYDSNATSFDTEVEQVVASKPDGVALIGYPEDGGLVLKGMIQKDSGPDKVSIYVTDGMQSNELYKAVDSSDPASTEGLRGTAPSAAPTTGAEFFPDEFKTFAPDVASPIYSAQAYDCVVLIALAAEQAKSDAPFEIAKVMNEVSGGAEGAEKCSTFKDCKALIADGTPIDYEGASGALDFTEYGEPSAGEYEVYTFGADGTYETDDRVTVSS